MTVCRSGPGAPRPGTIDPLVHLKWSRAIARGVRADYRFLRGSQEEAELEAVAALVVVEYATRFDPVVSYQRGATPLMRTAARKYRIGEVEPKGDRVFGAAVEVCGIDVTDWVRSECRRLTRGRVAKSATVAAELAARAAHGYARGFDPFGAFRGWCAVEVRSRCRREALRLRNGGTYHTTKTEEGKAVRVGPLPTARDGDNEDPHSHACDLALGADCRRPAADGDGPEEPWSLYITDGR